MTRSATRGLVVLGWSVAFWSCIDATDVTLLEITGTGSVSGQAFLDLNGNGTLDVADVPMRGVSVVLASKSALEVVGEATTDAAGLFTVANVPLGTYRLALDSAVLSDSLVVVGLSDSVVVGQAGPAQANVGASYPKLTLVEVRTAAVGRRVFTSGIALNPRQPFSDGEVFLRGTFGGVPAFLRATDVERGPVATGDSVLFLGTTALDNGQRTLDDVTPRVLVGQAAIPLPREVTIAVAAAADGGSLDGGLVRIRIAEITDTTTLPNDDFRFWAYAGTDSIEVVFRSFLGIATGVVRPDTVVRVNRAAGLLKPFDDGTGNVRWRLLPRAGGEVVLETKAADVAVTTAFDTAQASSGDMVEITVAVANAGPHTATGVEIDDPIPAGLLFVSASATRGTYDDVGGLWTLGALVAGGADTLRINVEVKGPPGVVTNTAQFGGLTLEVETNNANNSASANLTIS